VTPEASDAEAQQIAARLASMEKSLCQLLDAVLALVSTAKENAPSAVVAPPPGLSLLSGMACTDNGGEDAGMEIADDWHAEARKYSRLWSHWSQLNPYVEPFVPNCRGNQSRGLVLS